MWAKKVFIFLLCFTLTACSSKIETIEGYWMAENGDTISFNSDGKAIIDGAALNYSIYDENKLSITFLGFAEEYRFEIKADILELTDLSNNSIQKFYRDEKKQEEIKEKLNQLATEQKRAQEEKQAQKEYEKHIKSLKNRINSIDYEISNVNVWIGNNKKWISNNEQWIQDEYNQIDENKDEITKLQYSSDELAETQIDNLKEQQTLHYEKIDSYKNEIETYKTEITQYYKDIKTLELEKEKILKELTELGEI